MRRWHALPVAALVAFVAGAMLFGIATPRDASAVGGVTLEVDCDAVTAGIQTACAPANPAAATDAALVLVNNSGASFELGAFDFTLRSEDDTVLTASAGGAPATDANPDFNDAALNQNGAAWSCTPPSPDNDDQGDDLATDSPITLSNVGFDASFLSCFNASLTGPVIADGSSVVIATVHYTGVSVGVSALNLNRAGVGDVQGIPVVDCTDDCVSASVNIGGAAAPTATPTTLDTATPTATATSCVGAACPSPTSLAFVTVTPTPGPETPTAVSGGGETPAAPPPPGGGDGGGQPGGGTGAGGGRPITLPDTGSGANGGIDWSQATLLALLALAAGGVAGGAYLGATVVNRRTRP